MVAEPEDKALHDRDFCEVCRTALRFHPDEKHCPAGTEELTTFLRRRVFILENRLADLENSVIFHPLSERPAR